MGKNEKLRKRTLKLCHSLEQSTPPNFLRYIIMYSNCVPLNNIFKFYYIKMQNNSNYYFLDSTRQHSDVELRPATEHSFGHT